MSEPARDQHDPFAEFDGAYLLGALSPEDRSAYEEHLASCAACSRSVGELAGLPGLLAQSGTGRTPETGRPDDFPEPAPEESLTSLTARVRRSRKLRRLGVAGIAALALAACCAVLLLLARPPGEIPVQGGVDMAPMAALGPYPVEGSLGVTETGWGTKVDMSCSYGGDAAGTYVLVALGPDGRVRQQLAWWHAVPRDTARLSVATQLRRASITALEVRTDTGLPVLRSLITP